MAEITDRGKLEEWLANERREMAFAFGARAALRVIPLLGTALSFDVVGRRAVIVLQTFRAAAVANFASKWPNLATEVRAAARAAATAAADGAATYATSIAAEDAATAAAYAAAHAAEAVSEAAVYSASYGAAAYAAAQATERAAEAAPAADIWEAVLRDAEIVGARESGRGAGLADVSNQPLWRGHTPAWLAGAWNELKQHLLAADESWEIWTDWYDAILDGGPLDTDLELKKALIPDEIWKQSAAVVNAEIARLITEHNGRDRAGFRGTVSDAPPDPSTSSNAGGDESALLTEDGRRLRLEDGSGVILLEGRSPRPSEAQLAQARKSVAARPVAIALQFSDLHDRVEREIGLRREERRNDPEAARYIEFLEGLLPTLSKLSDDAAKLPAEPSDADVAPVLDEGWNLRNALEANVGWIAGREHARQIANGVLIGGIATAVMALGWAQLPVTAAAITLIGGPKLKEHLSDLIKQAKGS